MPKPTPITGPWIKDLTYVESREGSDEAILRKRLAATLKGGALELSKVALPEPLKVLRKRLARLARAEAATVHAITDGDVVRFWLEPAAGLVEPVAQAFEPTPPEVAPLTPDEALVEGLS